MRAAAGDAGQRLQPQQPGGGLGAEPGRGGAVGQRGGVPGGDGAVLGPEHGLQAGELLRRGTGADALVADQVRARDRGDELVVEPLVPGRGGEVVRVGGELVLRLAGDAVLLAQPFGGLAQGDGPVLRMALFTSRQPSVVETRVMSPAG